MHSADEIKQWFDTADVNSDGELTVDEFFQFSIGAAASAHGARALEHTFKQYDSNGEGLLDVREFHRAASEMGFGTVAADIFRNLDADQSGAISYRELADTLRGRTPASPDTRNLLLTMVWSSEVAATKQSERVAIESKKWRIKGHDVESIRAELQAQLRSSGLHVSDLLQFFDTDSNSDHQVDDLEFLSVMRNRFGYRGSSHVIMELFRSLDTDGTGEIGFDELFEFIRGRRHSLDRRNRNVRAMQLQAPLGARSSSLLDVSWDVESLRVLLKQMLERSQMGTAELMRAWDRSGDFTIGKHEFLEGIRGFLRAYEQRPLWEQEVRPVAEQAFTIINQRQGLNDAMGRHRASVLHDAIEAYELERWLRPLPKRPEGLEILWKRRSSAGVEAVPKESRAHNEESAVHMGRAPPLASPRMPSSTRMVALHAKPHFAPWSSSLHVPWTRPPSNRSPRSSPRRLTPMVGRGDHAPPADNLAELDDLSPEIFSSRLQSPRHRRLHVSAVLDELDLWPVRIPQPIALRRC